MSPSTPSFCLPAKNRHWYQFPGLWRKHLLQRRKDGTDTWSVNGVLLGLDSCLPPARPRTPRLSHPYFSPFSRPTPLPLSTPNFRLPPIPLRDPPPPPQSIPNSCHPPPTPPPHPYSHPITSLTPSYPPIDFSFSHPNFVSPRQGRLKNEKSDFWNRRLHRWESFRNRRLPLFSLVLGLWANTLAGQIGSGSWINGRCPDPANPSHAPVVLAHVGPGDWTVARSCRGWGAAPLLHFPRARVLLCESRGGRPGLSALTSFLVSVDVKQYWTMLTHWSQLVPTMSTDIRGH